MGQFAKFPIALRTESDKDQPINLPDFSMSGASHIQDARNKMKKAVDHTLHELSTLHTGKASPSMVESISVQAYGSQMQLKEVAAITTPDPRLIQIQPWDKSVIKEIEKALQLANLGINPTVDGNVVRLPIPEMSRERRQELVKISHRMGEEGRVGVRHARREALEALKKEQKDGVISEDDYHRLEKEIQQLTDDANKEIDKHLQHKEKDLMQV